MNKPVAWWDGNPKNAIGISKTKDCDDWFPLYTHSVKEQELLDEIAQLKHINRNWQISENILLLELEKLQMRELTDEEIEKLAEQYLSAHAQFIGAGECHYEGEIDFARAILRKASEK